jgi:hypothetical protein
MGGRVQAFQTAIAKNSESLLIFLKMATMAIPTNTLIPGVGEMAIKLPKANPNATNLSDVLVFQTSIKCLFRPK